MAIDREGLINNVLNGYGTAAKHLFQKGIGITGKDGKRLYRICSYINTWI